MDHAQVGVGAHVHDAQIERRPLDDPLVLRVDAKTVRVLDHLERRGPDRDRLRHAIPEGVGARAGDLVQIGVRAFAPKVILLQEVPDLDAVGPRDVGRGDPAVVLVDKPAGVAAGPDIVVGVRPVHDVEREVRHSDVIGPDQRAISIQTVLLLRSTSFATC